MSEERRDRVAVAMIDMISSNQIERAKIRTEIVKPLIAIAVCGPNVLVLRGL